LSLKKYATKFETAAKITAKISAWRPKNEPTSKIRAVMPPSRSAVFTLL
jgi:hypothetical protein